MATTFVKYKGRNVPVPERTVTFIGYMLFHEGASRAQTPSDKARFEQMARDFDKRTIGVGCTDLGLDQLLRGDPEKEREFLSLVRIARDRFVQFGKTIPAAYVDQFVVDPDDRGEWRESPWFFKVLDVIEALITGEPIPDIWADTPRL